MKKRTIGLFGVVGGVILTLFSLFADTLRIGSYPGINWAQTVGIVVGLVAVVVGLWLMYGKKRVS